MPCFMSACSDCGGALAFAGLTGAFEGGGGRARPPGHVPPRLLLRGFGTQTSAAPESAFAMPRRMSRTPPPPRTPNAVRRCHPPPPPPPGPCCASGSPFAPTPPAAAGGTPGRPPHGEGEGALPRTPAHTVRRMGQRQGVLNKEIAGVSGGQQNLHSSKMAVKGQLMAVGVQPTAVEG